MYKKLAMLLLGVWILSVMAYGDDDPLIGAWKLNLTKSKYNTSRPPSAQVNKYAPNGDNGVKVTIDSVDADGKPGHNEISATYDGKQYPVGTGTNAAGRKVAMSLKRTDANTTVRTNYTDGKPLSTETRVVSKDGKTLTITQTGVDEQGHNVDLVRVFDRQ